MSASMADCLNLAAPLAGKCGIIALDNYFERRSMDENGPQYSLDDSFKAAARLHQSRYRAQVLGVDCSEYGNRLCDEAARARLNYYHGLGVREAVKTYSKKRDADMLRSEHIPFNMLAPLASRHALLQLVLQQGLGIKLEPPFQLRIEWAPSPARDYLGDLTSFDTYIEGAGAQGERVGIGVEVKYTERAYRIGVSEAGRVRNQDSSYWSTTRNSGLYLPELRDQLGSDDLRQIWRNHLLGLAMVDRGDIQKFYSVTLHPVGNEHIANAVAAYRTRLHLHAREGVRAWTFEQYISVLQGDDSIEAWKQYLTRRYLHG